MATTRAHTEPEVLRWARETAGLSIDVAAHQIKVEPEILAATERGEHRLTLRQVERAADVYSRPIAALFMPAPVDEPDTEMRHRRLPGSPGLPWSPAMRSLTRLVDQRQQDVALLLEQLEEEPEWAEISAKIQKVGSGDIEDLATFIRDALDFSVDAQLQVGWSHQHAALNRWIDGVEGLGVIVTQSSTVELGESRGFVSPTEPVPLVVLNSGEHFIPARIFSLLHELAHLIEELVPRTPAVGTEKWCNSFAGAVTMPKREFIEIFNEERFDSRTVSDAVRRVSRRFVISQSAVALRAGELGLISEAQLQAVMTYLRSANADTAAPEKKNSGSGNFHNTNFSRLGPTLTRLTFGAMDVGQISQLEASRILATKVEHFDQLRERLVSRAEAA